MKQIKSYADAKEYLNEGGRDKLERPYANNTRIKWDEQGHDVILATYHGNTVARFFPDYTAYSSCGWRTMTTKERINWFLPDGFSLWQEKGMWFLSDRNKHKQYGFADGITIDKFGSVSNAALPTREAEIKALTKQINKYVKGYVKALVAGDIDSPSAGDCWYCAMQTESGESLGDATRDTGHLVSHFEESYYVPSLLMNAHKLYNNAMCIISQDAMARLWQTGEELSDWQENILGRDVKALLTKYLKKQFEIAQ